MEIRRDDLTGEEVKALIREHLHGMSLQSPPESIHALGIEQLQQPEVTFWSVWMGKELAGCGALKELDSGHGEVKSMRTASAHLRKGVASSLLQYIIKKAKRRGYRQISLETGSIEAFEPARRLYERFGFRNCQPFAEYTEDPNSVFMTLKL